MFGSVREQFEAMRPSSEFLTIKEFAAHRGVKEGVVSNWVNKGEMVLFPRETECPEGAPRSPGPGVVRTSRSSDAETNQRLTWIHRDAVHVPTPRMPPPTRPLGPDPEEMRLAQEFANRHRAHYERLMDESRQPT